MVKPPERGVFPLDHEAECKSIMKVYLDCINVNNKDNFPCREHSKAYLQCRMDRNLMAKENLDSLGFDESRTYMRKEQEVKENNAFVAGTGVKPGKWFSN